MKKKIVSIIIAATVVFGELPYVGTTDLLNNADTVYAATTAKKTIKNNGNIKYVIDKDGIIVKGCTNKGIKNLVIPEKIEGRSVVAIDKKAFANCHSLTNVTLPASLKKIGKSAFFSCFSLKKISIPGPQIKSIGDYAFYGCVGLENMDLPDGVTEIGINAFRKCKALNIRIPNSVKSIGETKYIDDNEENDCEHGNYSDIEGDATLFVEKGSLAHKYACRHRLLYVISDKIIPMNKVTVKKVYTAQYGKDKKFKINAKAVKGTVHSYITDNPSVATVDSQGNVTVKGIGVAHIEIASPIPKGYREYRTQCSVIVSKHRINPRKVVIMFDNSKTKWKDVYVNIWNDSDYKWYDESRYDLKYAKKMKKDKKTGYYIYEYNNYQDDTEVIFSNGDDKSCYSDNVIPDYVCIPSKNNDDSAPKWKPVEQNITKPVKATPGKAGITADKCCKICGAHLAVPVVIDMPKKVTLSKNSYVYDGKAKKPTVTVKDSKGKTISAKEYTVSYSNNKKVGTAIVKVTFKKSSKKYSGSLKKTFKIVR